VPKLDNWPIVTLTPTAADSPRICCCWRKSKEKCLSGGALVIGSRQQNFEIKFQLTSAIMFFYVKNIDGAYKPADMGEENQYEIV
jgi:hypothetical protein